MKMQNAWARLAQLGAVLCLTASAASAAPILYTFTATTKATMGSPSHLEKFELLAPDFLPVVPNGGILSFKSNDPMLLSCEACAAPSTSAVIFLRGTTDDLVQFRDADGILRPYFFPVNALTTAGIHDTKPGFNVAVGRLEVTEVAAPEPGTVGLTLSRFFKGGRRGGKVCRLELRET